MMTMINDLRKNPLPYLVQGVGVLVLLLNLWLASKLSPIAQDVLVINSRVQAIEDEITKTSNDHEDIQVIKEQVIGLRRDVNEMKGDLKILINR